MFGSAPLFFYILHLYLMHGLNRVIGLLSGSEHLVSMPNVGFLWLTAFLVAVPCWFACRRFGTIKRTSGARWMRYL